ncbi:MAG: hypothetical protein ACYDAC_06270 [Candidatus Dormibacteria bacterium]
MAERLLLHGRPLAWLAVFTLSAFTLPFVPAPSGLPDTTAPALPPQPGAPAVACSVASQVAGTWTVAVAANPKPYQVLFDPSLPCLAYRVRDRTSIERSSDGGRTWRTVFSDTATSTTLTGAKTTFAFNQVTLGLGGVVVGAEAGNGDAVVRSDDRGSRWALRNGGLAGDRVEMVRLAPGDPLVAYALVDEQVSTGSIGVLPGYETTTTIWRTGDGGTSWSRTTGLAGVTSFGVGHKIADIEVDPNDPAHLYAYAVGWGEATLLYESHDGAASWTPVATFANGVTQLLLTRSPTHPLRLYLVTQSNGGFASYSGAPLIFSDNDGAAWTAVPVPAPYYGVVGADPADGDRVLYMRQSIPQNFLGNTVWDAYYTDDGFATVQRLPPPPGAADGTDSPLPGAGAADEIQGADNGDFYITARADTYCSTCYGSVSGVEYLRFTPPSQTCGGGCALPAPPPPTITALTPIYSCAQPQVSNSPYAGAMAFDGVDILYTLHQEPGTGSNQTPNPALGPRQGIIHRLRATPSGCVDPGSTVVDFSQHDLDAVAAADFSQKPRTWGQPCPPPGSYSNPCGKTPYIDEVVYDPALDVLYAALAGIQPVPIFRITPDHHQWIGHDAHASLMFFVEDCKYGPESFETWGPDYNGYGDVLMAFDYTDGTLWSCNSQARIGHIDLQGHDISTCFDTFNRDSWGNWSMWALGKPGRLWVHSEDDQTVYDYSTDSCTRLATYVHRPFLEPSGEDEQMVCDPLTFGPGSPMPIHATVLWIRDATAQLFTAYSGIPTDGCQLPTRTTLAVPAQLTQNAATTLTAQLVSKFRSVPMLGQRINFTVDGVYAGTGTTDGAGRATVPYTASQPQGQHTVKATFAGTEQYLASSAIAPLAITVTTAPPTVSFAPVQGAVSPPRGSALLEPATGRPPVTGLEEEVQTQAQFQSQAQAQQSVQVQPGVMVQRQRQVQVATRTQVTAEEQAQQQEQLAAALRHRRDPGPAAAAAEVLAATIALGFALLLKPAAVARARLHTRSRRYR